MILFLLIILIFFILNIIIKNKKKLVIVYSVFLIIFSGFRSYTVGADTSEYFLAFSKYSQISYEWLASNWWSIKDPTFILLIKLLGNLSLNERMIFMFFSILYVYFIEKTIYKYSKNLFLSNLLFICLPYYFFGMTAIRQSIALSLCVYSLQFLFEKKNIQFLVTIIISSLFHSTSLVFLIAPFLVKIKNVKLYPFLLIVFTLLLSKYGGTLVFNLATQLLDKNRALFYLNYNSVLNNTLLIVNLVLLLSSYVLYKLNNDKDKIYEKTHYLILFGICMLPFCSIIAEFFRVSMYFMVFIIIALPNVIMKLKKRNLKFITQLILILSMVAYLIISNGNGYEIFPYSML